MDMMVWIWTGVVVMTLVLEFVSVDLICIWFTIASAIALILALCGVGTTIQIIVFVVVAFALLLGLRKICMKFIKTKEVKVNADSMIGVVKKLITPVSPDDMGTVKVNGITYNCTTKKKMTIEKDAEVTIMEINGNTLTVEPGVVEIKQEEPKNKKQKGEM